jgi:DNA-binding FadR family transcriptional regulator
MLLGKKNMKDLLELRLVFEEQGIWYLLEHFKNNKELLNSTVERLRTEVVNMEEAIDSMDMERRIEADYQFHKCLIDVCKNDLFSTLYETMRSFSYEEIKLAHTDIEDKHIIIADHNKLINAILQGDVLKAQESFRKHIRNQDPLFQEK